MPCQELFNYGVVLESLLMFISNTGFLLVVNDSTMRLNSHLHLP